MPPVSVGHLNITNTVHQANPCSTSLYCPRVEKHHPVPSDAVLVSNSTTQYHLALSTYQAGFSLHKILGFTSVMYYYLGTNDSYIFPPFSILGAALKKMMEEDADVILVAPLWPTHFWFPKILQLLVDCPRMLPVTKTLLTLPSDKRKIHSLFPKLHLTAFKLSSNRSNVEDHQNKLSRLSCSHGTILHENNIGVISKNGCVFALRDTLIPCHQL